MNKLKIFCFLISIEIFSSLLTKQNFDSKKEDFQKCKDQNPNQCTASKIESKAFQCCKQKMKTNGGGKSDEHEMCNIMLNPIKLAQDEIKTENGKKMIKELYGFNYFGADKKTGNMSFEYDYSCLDGNYSFNFNSQDYTKYEKEIFNYSNHCLRTLIKDLRPKNITTEMCFNSKLATTGNTGISCGFYEMKLYFNDSTVGDCKICFLFNEDILKNKNVGVIFKQISESLSSTEADQSKKELSYYQITMINQNGRYFRYNSLDDTVTIDNLANFINYSYLLFLILFII